MTRFSAVCPVCRKSVSLPITDATLEVPVGGPMRVTYTCTACDLNVGQDVPDEMGDSLASRGMPCERVELVVPSQHAPGPPLTTDDLIAFGLALEAATEVV